ASAESASGSGVMGAQIATASYRSRSFVARTSGAAASSTATPKCSKFRRNSAVSSGSPISRTPGGDAAAHPPHNTSDTIRELALIPGFPSPFGPATGPLLWNSLYDLEGQQQSRGDRRVAPAGVHRVHPAFV